MSCVTHSGSLMTALDFFSLFAVLQTSSDEQVRR